MGGGGYFQSFPPLALVTKGLKGTIMTIVKKNILKVKQTAIWSYIKRFAIDTFIETGTCKGNMVGAVLPYVKEIYSVELDETLCKSAQDRFADYPNVHILQGDSGKVLPEILNKINKPCLFWLDGHYSGGVTAKGKTETPILQELQAILNSPYNHVILIDDARRFTGEDDYPSVEAIKAIIHKAYPDWVFEVRDDIMRAHTTNFISMSSLGSFGGFGNQLFQYAALKIYAKENSLQPEVHQDWIGRKLFVGCNDLPLPQMPYPEKMIKDDCIWLNGENLKGCDIKGYFQYHTKQYAPHKDYFRSLYKFLPSLEGPLQRPVDQMRGRGNTLVGIHIRMGDYRIGSRKGGIAPTGWYLKWLEENWDKLDNPVLFIASDEIENVVEDFKDYKPSVFDGTNFLCDHYTLQHCDILLISNSTFSFTAAMLNEQAPKCYRPDFDQQKLVSFDPWDSKPTLPFPQTEQGSVKLHLGCGGQHFEGYINIDFKKTRAVDVIGDVRELPYEDNSVDAIESYHVLEHFPVCLMANINPHPRGKYAALIDILKEWNRVLKPNGNLVIEVPDFDAIAAEYATADNERKEELITYMFGGYRNNDIEDTHRWGTNKYRLNYILEKAGFRYIKFCEARDYHTRQCACLRVEAIK